MPVDGPPDDDAVAGGPSIEALDLAAVEDRLREEAIELAVVFGSVATESTHSFSDLDVAVRFEDGIDEADRHRAIERIAADLAGIVDCEAVDVLDLDRAPPAIGYRALSTGRRLVGDPDRADELEASFLVRKLDFDPITRQYRDAVASRLEDDTYGRA